VQALVRLILNDRPGALSAATAAIAQAGGNILGMDVVERDEDRVIDDFVVQFDNVDPTSITALLAENSDFEVDCIRVTPQVELHQELELISTLATSPRPSLELLARLVPAMVHCDWSVVVSSAGSGVAITHASANGPRIRWTSLPWLPLHVATSLDVDDNWVPSSMYSDNLSLAAAPIDATTCILACRWVGPTFRPREIARLGQMARLAGRLLPPDGPSTAALDAHVGASST
jgi:hypothetical protein